MLFQEPIRVQTLVAVAPVSGLLLSAKHWFVAAMVEMPCREGQRMTSSALNSEQDLASVPTAQGGLSRLVIAHLKSAGVPVAPLLRRVGLTPEVIADPEERLIVRAKSRFWTRRRLLCRMTGSASRWLAISIRAKSGCFVTSWLLRKPWVMH